LQKAQRPAAKRELVDFARQMHGLNLRAACQILNLSRSVYRYRPDTTKDIPVIEAIQAVIAEFLGWGSPKVY
jgi:putative transposase